MSLSNILGIASSGLSAAQAAIDTASNNVSNANTPGYTRQRINLSTNSVGQFQDGVSFGAAQRVAERFRETAVYAKSGASGFDGTTNSYLGELQAMMGPPGSQTGINASINRAQSAAIALSTPGAGQQSSIAFVSAAGDALRAFQQFDADLKQLRLDAEAEISALVPQVNQLLAEIHKYNVDISGTAANLRSNADVDQRNLAVQRLSEIVAISVSDNPNGTVTIMGGNGMVLLDQRLRQLGFSRGYNGGAEDFGAIDVNLSNGPNDPGIPTGQAIASSGIGGKLGALLNMRDVELPAARDELSSIAAGFAKAFNTASNKSTAVPAPQQLEGRNTGLKAEDDLHFTGKATFAVTDATGKVITKTTIDFTSGTSPTTVQDLVTKLNADLNVAPGFTTATFAQGVLTLSTGSAAYGVSVADDNLDPARRAGSGFSEFFGLNDLVRSSSAQLVPSGLTAADSHRLTGSTELMLRDSSGRTLATQTIDFDALAGTTVQDVVDELNAGSIGKFGAFSLGADGQFEFAPIGSAIGARLTAPRDSSARADTGVSFGALSGLLTSTNEPASFSIRPDILISPTKLPSATLDASAAVGEIAIGASDRSGFTNYLAEFDKPVRVGSARPAKTQEAIANMVAKLASRADLAKRQADNSAIRLTDATNRRDSVSGVNIDEELAQLVVFQNSYAAAARLISTTSQMYDTLLGMMR